MRHRIYTVLSIYSSVSRLTCLFLIKYKCGPNGSNQTILRQNTSIPLMLPRCQASARGGRLEGCRQFSVWVIFKILFLFTFMGFLSFSHDRQLDVGGPARTIRCTNLTELWMFFIGKQRDLTPIPIKEE